MPLQIIIQSWVFLLGHRWTPDANEDGITNSYNIFQTASPARWERRDVEGMLGEAEGEAGESVLQSLVLHRLLGAPPL